MTDNERQLLRAQLLIEAADLLDEGFYKPNTNDKIIAAKMNAASKKAHKDDNSLRNCETSLVTFANYDLFNPYTVSARRAHKNSAVRSNFEKRRQKVKDYLQKVAEQQ